MNPRTEKSLARLLDRMDRQTRRRPGGRFSPAVLALAAGLLLGYLLLTRLIPQAWPTLLAIEPEAALTGWPLLVWRISRFSLAYQGPVMVALVSACAVVVVLSYRSRVMRFVVWLAALGVVVLDAGILASTMLACLQGAGVEL